LWHHLGPLIVGLPLLALVTPICFSLSLKLTVAAFVYLVAIVVLALMGGFVPVIALSVVAVGLLDYFFTEHLEDDVIVLLGVASIVGVSGAMVSPRSAHPVGDAPL